MVSKSGNPSASRRRQSRANPQKWGRCRGLTAPAYVLRDMVKGRSRPRTRQRGGESRSGMLISRSLVRIQQGSPSNQCQLPVGILARKRDGRDDCAYPKDRGHHRIGYAKPIASFRSAVLRLIVGDLHLEKLVDHLGLLRLQIN